MTKKIRKVREAARRAAPAKTLPAASKSAATLPPAAAPRGAVVIKIGNIFTCEAQNLTAAQALYVIARDESNAGATDFPGGEIYQEGTKVARISYNGRAFDSQDRVIAECPSDSIVDKLKKAAGAKTEATLPALPGNGAAIEATKPADAEQLGEATSVTIAAQYLTAALAIAPRDDARFVLNGAYLHMVGSDMRLVATDGHRMIVMTIPPNAKTGHVHHAWGEAGIILPAEQLARISKYIGKDEGAAVTISFGAGHPSVSITEAGGMARFSVAPIDGKYPPYDVVMNQAAEAFTTQREPTETSAVDAKYLKSAGVIAAALDAPHVFPFVGADGKCSVFTFAGHPGALLYIMPVGVKVPALAVETMRVIGAKGMAGTIAALRAHQTRTRTASRNTRLPKDERDALVKKVEEYTRRIADILAATSNALPAPSASSDAAAGSEDIDEGVNA